MYRLGKLGCDTYHIPPEALLCVSERIPRDMSDSHWGCSSLHADRPSLLLHYPDRLTVLVVRGRYDNNQVSSTEFWTGTDMNLIFLL